MTVETSSMFNVLFPVVLFNYIGKLVLYMLKVHLSERSVFFPLCFFSPLVTRLVKLVYNLSDFYIVGC